MPEELHKEHVGPHSPKIEGGKLVGSGPVASSLGKEKYRSKSAMERVPKDAQWAKEFIKKTPDWLKVKYAEFLKGIPADHVEEAARRMHELTGEILSSNTPKNTADNIFKEIKHEFGIEEKEEGDEKIN